MTVKNNAITDFFKNLAAAISDGEGHWGASREFLKKTC